MDPPAGNGQRTVCRTSLSHRSAGNVGASIRHHGRRDTLPAVALRRSLRRQPHQDDGRGVDHSTASLPRRARRAPVDTARWRSGAFHSAARSIQERRCRDADRGFQPEFKAGPARTIVAAGGPCPSTETDGQGRHRALPHGNAPRQKRYLGAEAPPSVDRHPTGPRPEKGSVELQAE